jgi:hypothetical protein
MFMRRTTVGLLVLLALSVLAAPVVAAAQQPTKVYRIGRLSPGFPPSQPSPSREAFRQALHELGYIEGQNLVRVTTHSPAVTLGNVESEAEL